MTRSFIPFAVRTVVAFLCVSSHATMAQEKTAEKSSEFAGKVLVIPIARDDISDGRRLRELGRMLEEASDAKASAVVFDVNVRGTVSWDSQERLLDLLPGLNVPSIGFRQFLGDGAWCVDRVGM